MCRAMLGAACRCDEPWVEAIFQEDKEGWCQLVVSPLFRLVSKANATVRDVGPPEGVVESVGNFITGDEWMWCEAPAAAP